MHERVDHHQGDDPDRYVDVEVPAPVPIVGNPAAQRGPEDRRDHQAHAPRRHRHLLLFGRKGLHQDGLRGRNHGRARHALREPEQHHLPQRARRAARRRGGDEGRHRGHEIALAAEARGNPAGHRNHDPVGDQVAGDHPGDFVDAGREAALHVRQRDVDDRGIEHLEHGAQHHRERYQPLVRGGGTLVGDREPGLRLPRDPIRPRATSHAIPMTAPHASEIAMVSLSPIDGPVLPQGPQLCPSAHDLKRRRRASRAFHNFARDPVQAVK